MSMALQFVALASDVFAVFMSMSMSMLTCFVFNNLDRNHSDSLLAFLALLVTRTGDLFGPL